MRARRHPARPLHLYVFDGPVEVLARHLLLLGVVHDWAVPLRHRANTFLEVYGNALVQERTERYVADKGTELVDSPSGECSWYIRIPLCV